MKPQNKMHGFTLIELLIVIGILGILVVMTLITLKPVEAMKRTRDAKRLKDLATLQLVIEQWINAGNTVPPGWTSPRNSGDNNGSTNCDASGWLGLDVCKYIEALPVDPLNKTNVKVAGTTSDPAGCTSETTAIRDAYYWFAFDPSTNHYEINAVQ